MTGFARMLTAEKCENVRTRRRHRILFHVILASAVVRQFAFAVVHRPARLDDVSAKTSFLVV
jgi:hypothetical protein